MLDRAGGKNMTFITDNYEINSERVYTDEGFLIVPAVLARTGVQEYTSRELGLGDADDVVRVYRAPDEVFSDDAMRSFAGKPVTDGHPPELLKSTNAKAHTKGAVVSDVERDGDTLVAKLSIFDADLIDKIHGGKVEVSNGYKVDLVLESGRTPEGAAYDAVQRSIRGNHVAIVDRGRAGYSCRLSDSKPGALKMPIVINDVQYETSNQSLVGAVSVLQKSLIDAEAMVEKTTAEKAALEKKNQAELDAKQAELDDAKSKILSDEAIEEMVVDRVAVATVAVSAIDGYEIKGKSTLDIKRDVIAAHNRSLCLDGKSDDYINAAYDIAVSDESGGMDRLLKRSLHATDSKRSSIVDDARAKFIESSRTLSTGGK